VSELLPILKEEMTSALTPLIARNESSALDAGDASS